MPRKKKEVIKQEFECSKYQKDIFEFIEKGQGNLVVEASAGCGKTTTMVKCLNLIGEDKKVLFCAFNNEITKEIQKKVKGLSNVLVSTVHSLGLKILKNNLEDKLSLDDKKYKTELYSNIGIYSTMNYKYLSKKENKIYFQNILRLIDLLRYNLLSTKKQAKEIIERYDIQLVGDEVEVALKLIEWGKTHIDTIDFTDMAWLPQVLYLKPYGCQFDFIFVDECQDLSTMQLELILKCRKINTRYVFCGDVHQSIYGFCSADINSFKKIKELPNTKCLPLPISYRCAKSIVEYAKKIVSTIEPNDDGRIGEVKTSCKICDVKDGDMVLCRNNAPLIHTYNEFLKLGKKCYVRGKDIGLNLKSLVELTNKKELNVDLSKDGVFIRLYETLFDLRDKLMSENNMTQKDAYETSAFSNRLDSIKTLKAISIGINTSEELITRIDNIFSDKNKEGIILSTIHKAKGLEAENVFIICPSLMPSKSAKQEWEKQQEVNLKYVAFTRAKNTLCIVDENEFKTFIDENNFKLDFIENKVCQILNKKPTIKKLTLEDAKEFINKIMENNSEPKKQNFNNVVRGLRSISDNKSLNRSLSSIGRRKIIRNF